MQTHSFSWPLAGWGCGRGAGAADCLDPRLGSGLWAVGWWLLLRLQVQDELWELSQEGLYLPAADPSTLILSQLERRPCTAGTDGEWASRCREAAWAVCGAPRESQVNQRQ